MELDNLTPKYIVSELNKYIIGQDSAKRLVSIALRNRIRRMRLDDELKKEVIPKNILMMGPTGVGKTEIARRLAQIACAPFVKVEATRFTEVGYVGKNVESMVKELVEVSINLVRKEMISGVEDRAKMMVEERILEGLIPGKKKTSSQQDNPLMEMFKQMAPNSGYNAERKENKFEYKDKDDDNLSLKKEEILKKLRNQELEDVEIEIEIEEEPSPMFAGMGSEFEDMGMQMGEMLSSIVPKKKKTRRVTVENARRILFPIEAEKLIDKDKMVSEGLERAENRGIIFIDEIDKIASKGSSNQDVSREGVQRDLLPIVEGTNISTKYGQIKTDYILFIAAGAFHVSKPSDLIPEMQGRFPVRVELEDLTKDDFIKILTEPQNAIIKQYKSLLKTDGVTLDFSNDGINELASMAFELNQKVENIGARRLYTVIERVLEEVSYEAPATTDWSVVINKEYVIAKLGEVVENENLREFIL